MKFVYKNGEIEQVSDEKIVSINISENKDRLLKIEADGSNKLIVQALTASLCLFLSKGLKPDIDVDEVLDELFDGMKNNIKDHIKNEPDS